MEVNWSNFQKLRDYIASLPPENIQMDKLLFINRDNETVAEARRPECGTVGCIKGCAFILFAPDESLLVKKLDYDRMKNIGRPDIDDIVNKSLFNADSYYDLGVPYANDYVFLAKWHPTKNWDSGDITHDEVIQYLDKAIARKDLMVSLDE